MKIPDPNTAISLHQAAKSPHLLRSVHVSTIHRWRQKGLRGIKLETWLIAGRRVTTEQAIQEFLYKTNNSFAQSKIVSKVCKIANDRAKLELQELGIPVNGLSLDQQDLSYLKIWGEA